MLVSVIMPAYNASLYVQQAIQSLVNQRGDFQLDIIVIDDGSTDDTADIVRGLEQRHPEVRLIVAPHAGISAARNRGFDAMSDNVHFVTFLDADDIAVPGRIARQLALLRADPSVDVVYGMLRMFDDLDNETLSPSSTSRTVVTRAIQLSVGLFRRQVIDQLGHFDETLVQAEDTDYLFRMVESGASVLMEDDIATFHRRHDANTTRNVLEARREFMKAIYKSVKRRRQSGGENMLPSFNSMFAERTQFEELFETCPSNTRS